MNRVLAASLFLLVAACSNSNNANNTNNKNNSDDVAVDTATDLDPDMNPEPDSMTPDADQGTPWPSCAVRFLEPGEEPFDTLQEYCLFGGDATTHQPNVGVFAFEPAAVLYADESSKYRFLAVPPGETIAFSDTEMWDYPLGTILVKTFYYPLDEREPDGARQLLETRLLVKGSDEWETHTYVWDSEQTVATFDRLGKTIPVTRTLNDGTDETFNYRTPNKNQCKNCHGQNDLLVPLGPKTAQLNINVQRDGESVNQLSWLESHGLFDSALPDTGTLPALTDPRGTGDLNLRARSYFEANCAHCHNPIGAGGSSGLDLSYTQQNPVDYGVCKRPVAAGEGAGGRFYDIVPGDADGSIVIFRMQSVDPQIKMPELPTQTSDQFGVSLITDWINSLTPPGCP